jgi:murein DD-endopeptidase MepM/ murein hydrolase activator NlpD
MPDQEAPTTATPHRRITFALALVLGAALIAFPAYASTESDLEDAKRDLDAAQAALDAKVREFHETEARLAEAQDAAAAARVEIVRLEGELDRIQESLNERAAAAYMSGGSISIGALLTSNSLQDAADRLQYTMSVVQGDADLATEVSSKTAELRWQRQRFVEAARRERELKEMLEAQRLELEDDVDRLTEKVSGLRADLEAQEEAAIGLTTGVSITGTGAIQTCPVAGPSSFVDSFGDPRPGGRVHEGIDLIAAAGTPVVAVAPGVAHTAGSIGGLGVVVQHPNGDWTFYAHLGTTVSGSVSAGQQIGTIGSDGVSVTHLHFEYHPNGGPAANPYSALLAVC